MKFTSIFFTASESILEIHFKCTKKIEKKLNNHFIPPIATIIVLHLHIINLLLT